MSETQPLSSPEIPFLKLKDRLEQHFDSLEPGPLLLAAAEELNYLGAVYETDSLENEMDKNKDSVALRIRLEQALQHTYELESNRMIRRATLGKEYALTSINTEKLFDSLKVMTFDGDLSRSEVLEIGETFINNRSMGRPAFHELDFAFLSRIEAFETASE